MRWFTKGIPRDSILLQRLSDRVANVEACSGTAEIPFFLLGAVAIHLIRWIKSVRLHQAGSQT